MENLIKSRLTKKKKMVSFPELGSAQPQLVFVFYLSLSWSFSFYLILSLVFLVLYPFIFGCLWLYMANIMYCLAISGNVWQSCAILCNFKQSWPILANPGQSQAIYGYLWLSLSSIEYQGASRNSKLLLFETFFLISQIL